MVLESLKKSVGLVTGAFFVFPLPSSQKSMFNPHAPSTPVLTSIHIALTLSLPLALLQREWREKTAGGEELWK